MEHDAEISPGEDSDLATARTLINFVRKKVKDLDAHLSTGQRAEMLAFHNLVETKLDAATIFSTWCEAKGFAEFQKVAYTNKLAFPLNYIIPWSQRREVLRKYGHLSSDKVYGDAIDAIMAMADRLRISSGRFFFGHRPSTLDALLVGHLLFYRLSPAAAPILQAKVASQPVLCDYLDYVMSQFFATVAPRAGTSPEASTTSSWSEAAQGQRSKPVKVEPTKAELEFKRNGRLWLIGAGTAIAAYVLLSGRYIQVAQLREMLQGAYEDVEDEDDDDGGAAED